MSKFEANEPSCTRYGEAIRVLVHGRSKDLGGFCVRRVLPAPMARSVGPFVFFDEMGPADFPAGQGINVRPHPHIGLATVTFLFEGEIMHRDSLGYMQPIRPGAVNLMTAGSGIVHSERTSPELLETGQRLHGLQVWMALPEDVQEIDPSFFHYPEAALPVIEKDGVVTTVIIGSHAGAVSPVKVHPETIYLSMSLEEGVRQKIDATHEQLAVRIAALEGRVARERRLAMELVEIESLPRGVRILRVAVLPHETVVGGGRVLFQGLLPGLADTPAASPGAERSPAGADADRLHADRRRRLAFLLTCLPSCAWCVHYPGVCRADRTGAARLCALQRRRAHGRN